jgi:hypothetical protein
MGVALEGASFRGRKGVARQFAELRDTRMRSNSSPNSPATWATFVLSPMRIEGRGRSSSSVPADAPVRRGPSTFAATGSSTPNIWLASAKSHNGSQLAAIRSPALSREVHVVRRHRRVGSGAEEEHDEKNEEVGVVPRAGCDVPSSQHSQKRLHGSRTALLVRKSPRSKQGSGRQQNSDSDCGTHSANPERLTRSIGVDSVPPKHQRPRA